MRRREEGQRGQKKTSVLFFLAALEGAPPPLPTNVHPTFMPMKQLELKPRERWREAGWSGGRAESPNVINLLFFLL